MALCTSSGAISSLESLVNAVIMLMDQLSANASTDDKPKSGNGNHNKNNNNKSSSKKNNGKNHNDKSLVQALTKLDSPRESPPPRKKIQPKAEPLVSIVVAVRNVGKSVELDGPSFTIFALSMAKLGNLAALPI